ncbi:hypothetical protein GGF50DRAFT_121345 [Schizophyllum commune]
MSSECSGALCPRARQAAAGTEGWALRMSSTCAVYLAIDAHDALEYIVVASTPALHVATRPVFRQHSRPKNAHLDGERRGAPPHAPKLVDKVPRVRVQTQNYRILTPNAPRSAREFLAECLINMGRGAALRAASDTLCRPRRLMLPAPLNAPAPPPNAPAPPLNANAPPPPLLLPSTTPLGDEHTYRRPASKDRSSAFGGLFARSLRRTLLLSAASPPRFRRPFLSLPTASPYSLDGAPSLSAAPPTPPTAASPLAQHALNSSLNTPSTHRPTPLGDG